MLGKKKKKAVLWLTTPSEKAYTGKEALFYAVLRLLAVNVLLFAAVKMLTDVWSEFALEKNHALFLIFLSAVCALLYELILPFLGGKFPKKEKWIRAAGVTIGLCLLFRILTKVYWRAPLALEDGLLMIGNNYLELFNLRYQTAYLMDIGLTDYVSYALTYLFAAVLFLLYDLSYLLRRTEFWIAPPTLVLSALLLVGKAPSFFALGLFLFGFYLLFSTSAVTKIGRPVNSKGQSQRGRYSAEILQRLGASVLLVGGMLLIFLVMQKPARGLAVDSSFSAAVRRAVWQNSGGRKGAFLDFQIFSKSAEVSNKAPKYRDTKIMTVTADGEIQGNIYLKDFEGMRYQRGKWISMDSLLKSYCIRDDMDQKTLQHLLNEGTYQGFCTWWNAFYKFPRQAVTYTIQYQKVVGEAYPLPYFINTEDVSDHSLTGDVLVKKSAFRQKLTVSGLSENVFALDDISALSTREGAEKVKEAWSWYNAYVEKNYLNTGVEFESVSALAGNFGKASVVGRASMVNTERMRLASKVSGYLRGLTYSWDLDALGSGTDPVDYFLSTSRKGYCVHFASAGVLILREMGVPARYAEGYIIKKDAFRKNEDGTYTAQAVDRNRHAWAEIYLDQIGWIPIEMTPGYSDTTDVLQTDLSQEEKRKEEANAQTPSPQEGDTNEQDESNALEDPEPDEEDPVKMPSPEDDAPEDDTLQQEPPKGGGFWGGIGDEGSGSAQGAGGGGALAILILKIFLVAAGIGALGFAAGGFVTNRVRAYYRIVDSEFGRGKFVSVVRRINRRMVSGLRRTGKLRKRYPTDEEYGEILKKAYPAISKEDWDTFMAIVKEAAFSADGIERDKAGFCKEIYEKVRFSKGDVNRSKKDAI